MGIFSKRHTKKSVAMAQEKRQGVTGYLRPCWERRNLGKVVRKFWGRGAWVA